MGTCAAEQKVKLYSEYFFKQIEYDINSGKKDEMKERCKLEVKINNISSGSCKVILNQYTDKTRKTILKKEGETETASVDSSPNSISFNKFFIMDYYFESEQQLDFIISGTIEGKVSTTLPSIMGSRGQKLIKPIEGEENAKLEINGYAYKNKETSTFLFNVELNGNFNMKGINYTIIYLGNKSKPHNNKLYRSEVLNPKVNPKLCFAVSRIPDIYLTPDLNPETNNVEIAIFNPLILIIIKI